MAITAKLNQEWARNETADAVFEVRAVMQDAYNNLVERLAQIDVLASGASFGPVDNELKQEGQAIRTILNQAKNALDGHAEFLNWTQP
jgi:hypothetical protein